ncbi:hypothetical protein [Thiohalophilus thiocyanatoxydans]|uniref:Uncharacterized protein n=1 Tax=Thiohalophilus thiocyanatoxydans TaxID=381308 RepID=A0A4R8IKB1_9GAMM|nr:hypothetical protein [Thiohalophilus thiocyanatoxydans]TDY01171.1 hypothetical protein EDC23_1918 [Thiohalophilus thiocyanatoxydans]
MPGRLVHHPLVYALLCFSGFIALVLWRAEQPATTLPDPTHDRVVIAAPVLIALYGGDRFLAADLETIRLSATGISTNGQIDAHYLIRAHKVVSRLNPCQENNYYFANALLSWGGAVEEGGVILQRATECRFWDELPPFLYGFNQYFFNRNISEAQQALEIAAQRSNDNAAGYRKLAVMIEAEQLDDARMARKFLVQERDQAEDPKLRAMLDKRVTRVEGLITLRDAQRTYEEQTGKTLQDPGALIEAGILDAFPRDPLNWGYEFKEGRFILKEIKVGGVQRPE